MRRAGHGDGIGARGRWLVDGLTFGISRSGKVFIHLGRGNSPKIRRPPFLRGDGKARNTRQMLVFG